MVHADRTVDHDPVARVNRQQAGLARSPAENIEHGRGDQLYVGNVRVGDEDRGRGTVQLYGPPFADFYGEHLRRG